MNLTLILVLFCLYLLIGGGIISIWQAYKIAVKKEYSDIKDRWQNKPNNPEKVAALFSILYMAEGVGFFLATAAVFKFGVVDTSKVVFLIFLAVTLGKKWAIQNANKQT